MKLEKRSSGEAEETPIQETPSGKKPVVVYIMILFIAAFLLMALSFFMHQRSNTEALGELQDSVSAMQEIQNTQDKVIQLQEELSALTENQKRQVEAKITALMPEPLPPVVLEESEDEPVTSEIVYPTKNFALVAPFGSPVVG